MHAAVNIADMRAAIADGTVPGAFSADRTRFEFPVLTYAGARAPHEWRIAVTLLCRARARRGCARRGCARSPSPAAAPADQERGRRAADCGRLRARGAGPEKTQRRPGRGVAPARGRGALLLALGARLRGGARAVGAGRRPVRGVAGAPARAFRGARPRRHLPGRRAL
ncbi:MAG: hypothetical protein EBU46_19040 [Nitrosomonadaceae bacterium]|nr:hypothetical protein [Nitrosomonadaceae bacterium]